MCAWKHESHLFSFKKYVILIKAFSSENAKNLLQTPHPCEAGRACVLDGQKKVENLGSFPSGTQAAIKKFSLLFKTGPYFPLKNPFISLNCILSGDELLPPPKRHSAEVWSRARLTLPLWLLGRSNSDIWSLPSFNESPDWGCGRRSMAGRHTGGQPPRWGRKWWGWLYSQDHLCVTGDPQLAVRSHFSPNVTPFVLWKASLGYVSAAGQKIMCKLTPAAYFRREGAQPASHLWEEVFCKEWWMTRI